MSLGIVGFFRRLGVVLAPGGGKALQIQNSRSPGYLKFDSTPIKEYFEHIVEGSLSDAATAGGVFAWANPEDEDIYVTSFFIEVTNVADGVGTNVDAGIAADGTTSDNSLLDGQDVKSATGIFASSNPPLKVTSSQYITISEAAGDVTNLAGKVFYTYIKAAAA